MNSFNIQKKRATARYYNKKLSNGGPLRLSNFYNSSDRGVGGIVRSAYVGKLASRAYKSKGGYAFGRNPKTGEKEMFVRGTTFKHGGIEWLQNYLESPLGGRLSAGGAVAKTLSGRVRRQYSKRLTRVAKKHGVSRVYGHSRGAAVVEDMRLPGVDKIGLDGATVLNGRSTITNYRQNQLFDRLIGLNSSNAVVERKWTPIWSKRYHRVFSR